MKMSSGETESHRPEYGELVARFAGYANWSNMVLPRWCCQGFWLCSLIDQAQRSWLKTTLDRSNCFSNDGNEQAIRDWPLEALTAVLKR